MKYIHLLLLEVKKSVHFKIDIASNLLFLPIKLLIIATLWGTLFKSVEQIGMFRYQEIILYLSLIHIFQTIMLIKTPVFNRDHRVDHRLRNFLQIYPFAVFLIGRFIN